MESQYSVVPDMVVMSNPAALGVPEKVSPPFNTPNHAISTHCFPALAQHWAASLRIPRCNICLFSHLCHNHHLYLTDSKAPNSRSARSPRCCTGLVGQSFLYICKPCIFSWQYNVINMSPQVIELFVVIIRAAIEKGYRAGQDRNVSFKRAIIGIVHPLQWVHIHWHCAGLSHIQFPRLPSADTYHVGNQIPSVVSILWHLVYRNCCRDYVNNRSERPLPFSEVSFWFCRSYHSNPKSL